MTTGVIQSLTRERGFGFIKCPHGNDDIFFHHTKVDRVQFQALKEGQPVRFKVAITPKGLEAVGVKPA